MRIALLLLAMATAAPLALAQTAQAGRAVRMNDSQFARSFVCPESVPEAKRRDETKRFVDWVAATHPDWDVDQMTQHRLALLMAHGCYETLRNIRDAQSGATNPAGNSVRQ